MPRTKVVRKRRVTNSSMCSDGSDINDVKKKDISMQIEEVNSMIEDKIIQLNHLHKNQLRNLKSMYGVLKLRMMTSGLGNKKPSEIGNMDETDNSETSSKESKKSSDTNPRTKSQRSVRKRSNSCNSRSTQKKPNVLRSASSDRNVMHSASKFKTPVNRNIPSMPFVTPKVNPNIPLSVLRRPRQGEFAMSISGSPLMVSSVTYDEMASVSVPLPDGRVLSILPTEGIAAANLNLDETTRKQLRKLHSNISKCLGK